MLIKFLVDRTVKAAGGESFIAGKEYDLPESSAQRWIRRGVAVIVTRKEVKSIDEPTADKAIKSPPRKKSKDE